MIKRVLNYLRVFFHTLIKFNENFKGKYHVMWTQYHLNGDATYHCECELVREKILK